MIFELNASFPGIYNKYDPSCNLVKLYDEAKKEIRLAKNRYNKRIRRMKEDLQTKDIFADEELE
jgi:hypothetical protein